MDVKTNETSGGEEMLLALLRANGQPVTRRELNIAWCQGKLPCKGGFDACLARFAHGNLRHGILIELVPGDAFILTAEGKQVATSVSRRKQAHAQLSAPAAMAAIA